MIVKFGMRALSLLLIIALVGAIFVPAASAEENMNSTERDELIENNYIPVETALEHAKLYMWEYTSQGLDENTWTGASINEKPTLIYDINGKILFYRFSVEKKNKEVGLILTPASKVLGVSVQSLEEPDSYDIQSSIDNANNIVKSNYPDYKIVSSKIVCYDYPRMGIMIELVNPTNNEEMSLLFDALEVSDNSNKNIENPETKWSYYQQISDDQLLSNIDYWNLNSKKLEISNSDLKDSGFETGSSLTESNIESYNEITAGTNAVGESNYISSFPTVLQEQSNWCQIATAWLITKYYYPSNTRTQTIIANHMGVYSNTGPTWLNYLHYYTDSYSQGGLGKTNSVSSGSNGVPDLTYQKTKTEINANRPISVTALMISEDGNTTSHERACIGYWQYTSGDRLYKFSDPADKKTRWVAADTDGLIDNYQGHVIVN